MTTHQTTAEKDTIRKSAVAGVTTISADNHRGMPHAATLKTETVAKEERDRDHNTDQTTSAPGEGPIHGPKTEG